MKKACAFIVMFLGIICCTAAVNASDLDIGGGEISLTPYKNLLNEGQISSTDLIVSNNESSAQKVSFRFGGTDNSNIVLEDKSVLKNDFGDEKVAFVHLVNTETGEKYLINENNDESIEVGILEPGEELCFKFCGEMNVKANWMSGDSLKINLFFSMNPAEAIEETTTVDEISETGTEETTTVNANSGIATAEETTTANENSEAVTNAEDENSNAVSDIRNDAEETEKTDADDKTGANVSDDSEISEPDNNDSDDSEINSSDENDSDVDSANVSDDSEISEPDNNDSDNSEINSLDENSSDADSDDVVSDSDSENGSDSDSSDDGSDSDSDSSDDSESDSDSSESE